MSQPSLPRDHWVLEHAVPFSIAGYEDLTGDRDFTFAPEECSVGAWYEAFLKDLESSIGQRYRPICRIGDGELAFMFGHVPPTRIFPLKSRAYHLWKRLKGAGTGLTAGESGLYRSGTYSDDEMQQTRARYFEALGDIAGDGVLAPMLTWSVRPFQERYFPKLRTWLREGGPRLTLDNYVPFYFVYAALAGPERERLLRGRRVLVVHGADGEKRQQIEAGLTALGADLAGWHTISRDRSLFDEIDVSQWVGKVDLALVGAGVGKPFVLQQMRPLAVPCVDAGYMFEVWARPELGKGRAFCELRPPL